jgi:hypothetical protein
MSPSVQLKRGYSSVWKLVVLLYVPSTVSSDLSSVLNRCSNFFFLHNTGTDRAVEGDEAREAAGDDALVLSTIEIPSSSEKAMMRDDEAAQRLAVEDRRLRLLQGGIRISWKKRGWWKYTSILKEYGLCLLRQPTVRGSGGSDCRVSPQFSGTNRCHASGVSTVTHHNFTTIL